MTRGRTWALLGPAAVLAGLMLFTIFAPRASHGAELHPAMTTATPPGWQLHRALPGKDLRPIGRFFDNQTGCQLDLTSMSFVVPSGTRLACLYVDRDRKVKP